MRPVLVVIYAAAVFVGCAPVKTALDVGDAVCQELEQQPETDYVRFTCAAVDVASGVSRVFLAKVKKQDAHAFAALHCPKDKP